jgi:glycosyltransferase involved in cell wall biosynthesis
VTKLVVVSSASILFVNRAAYRSLALDYGVDLHLVIPFFEGDSNLDLNHDVFEGEGFEVTYLKLSGLHTRFQIAKNFRALINNLKPSHMLMDFDPATLIVLQAIFFSRKFKTKIAVISLENFERNFLRESWFGVIKCNIKLAFGGLFAHSILCYVKSKISVSYAVSNDGINVLRGWGFATVYKSPLGFDDKLFHKKPLQNSQNLKNMMGICDRTIAYFGRLVPEKGLDVLLDALVLIKDLKWHFLLDTFKDYQSPYESHLLQKIEQLDLNDRVIYFDANHSEMPDFINIADVVVLPSIQTPKFKEQYGRVIQEVMACEKIIVGSNTGAIPELIGEYGYLFSEGDVKLLADILRNLIMAPMRDLNRLGSAARQYAVDNLSAKSQARLLIDTFLK